MVNLIRSLLATALVVFGLCLAPAHAQQTSPMRERPLQRIISKRTAGSPVPFHARVNANGVHPYEGSAACDDYTFSFTSGDPGKKERLASIRLRYDGSYVATGSITDGAQQSGLIMLIGKDGAILNATSIAQAGADIWFKSLRITADNGWVAAGFGRIQASGETFSLLAKFSATGTIEWNTQIPGAITDLENGAAEISILEDLSYGFAFTTGANGVVAGICNTDGSMRWKKLYGTPGTDTRLAGLCAAFDGLFLAMTSVQSGKHLSYTSKIDLITGNTIYASSLGDAASGKEFLLQQSEYINIRMRSVGLMRNDVTSPWQLVRVTTGTTGKIEHYDLFSIPGSVIDTNTQTAISPWSEHIVSSNPANATSIDLVKAIPDMYGANYWSRRIAANGMTVSSIERSYDGGLIISGNLTSGNGDIAIIKTDSTGRMLSCTTADQPYQHQWIPVETASPATLPSFVILQATSTAAWTASATGMAPQFSCRDQYCKPGIIDTTCRTSFHHSYRSYSYSDLPKDLIELSDGRLLVVGLNRDNPYLAEDRGTLDIYNKNGEPVSNKYIDYGTGTSIIKTANQPNGGIVTVSSVINNQKPGLALNAYDASMNLVWEKVLEQPEYSDMITDAAGNIYLTSYAGPNFFEVLLHITKLDPSGNLVWRKNYTYGNKNFQSVQFARLCILGDQLLLTEEAFTNIQTYTCLASIRPTDGSVNWAELLGNPAGYDLHLSNQLFTAGNKLYLTGYDYTPGSSGSMVLVQVDASGKITDTRQFSNPRTPNINLQFLPLPGGQFQWAGGGFDYVTPSNPLLRFTGRLDSSLNIVSSRSNIQSPTAYLSKMIRTRNGELFELDWQAPAEVYAGAIQLRKMNPDGSSGNCQSDTMVLQVKRPVFNVTPASFTTNNAPLSTTTFPRSESPRRLALDSQFCLDKSKCDTLFLNHTTDSCSDSIQVVFANRSPGCTAHVNWLYDSAFVKSLIANDTFFRYVFINPGKTGIKATMSNGCRLYADSIQAAYLQLDVLDLGADTIACAGTTVVLHANGKFRSYRWQDGSTDSILAVKTAGIYSLTATGLCGQTLTDSIRVQFRQDSLPNWQRDRATCNDEAITLLAPAGYQGYRWFERATGDTLTGSTITISPKQNTVYYLLATTIPGNCTVTDSVVITNPAFDPYQPGTRYSFMCGRLVTTVRSSGFS